MKYRYGLLAAVALGGLGGLLALLFILRPKAPRPAETDQPPVITIVTCFPGLSASAVEKTITRRVEGWMRDLPGLATTESKSISGVSMVKVVLHRGSPDTVLAQVNARVLAGLPSLPPHCPPPLVQLGDPGQARLLGLVVVQNTELKESELRSAADLQVRPRLAGVPGIRLPVLLGGSGQQVIILLDPERLRKLHLGPGTVLRALQENLEPMVPGKAEFANRSLLLEVEPMKRPRELHDIVLRAGDKKQPILLKDVGRVEEGPAEQSVSIRYQGKPAVCLPVFADGPTDGRAALFEALASIDKTLPRETQLYFLPCATEADTAGDLTVYIRTPSYMGLAEGKEQVSKVESFLEKAIPAEEREWILSEQGVAPDPSALYTQNSGPQDVIFRVRLSSKRAAPATKYADTLRRRFAEERKLISLRSCFRAGPPSFSALDRGALADFAITIREGSTKRQLETARQLYKPLKSVAGVAEVHFRSRVDKPKLELIVERVRAAEMGLSPREVVLQATLAFNSAGLRLDRTRWVDSRTGNTYPIEIRYVPEGDQRLRDILNIDVIGLEQGDIKLTSLLMIRKSNDAVEIHDRSGSPVFDILISATDGNGARLQEDLEKLVAEQKAAAPLHVQVERLTPPGKRR